MSLEHGGRADKEGNTYENRFLARLFLQLINEEFQYIQVEAVERNSDFAEFIAVDQAGTRRYYQCKASNGDSDHWRISDLRSYDIFSNAQKIVDADTKNEYIFISPLGYDGLDSLCDRARTSSSTEDFVKYQLTKRYQAYFNSIAEDLELDVSASDDCAKLVQILARCRFETYGRSREEKEDLEARIGYMFFGPAKTVRILLEQYANDDRQYGVKITAHDLMEYLKKQKISLRDIRRDERVLLQIQTLNDVRWGYFLPINGVLLHRRATEQLIQEFEAGSSLILHGRAGAGKSGCAEEFIQYLKKKEILYLAIKLDKEIPQKSADDYGKELGLPQSPVYCLNAFAPQKPCVLILDQLDSLRWTSTHSASALDVCKEMIRQAEEINKNHGGQISILMVSRTFDLETDPGLQSLFEQPKEKETIKWSKIQVGLLSDDEVQNIVGQPYVHMPMKLKKTLQIPSSLLVWSHLKSDDKRNAVTSSFQLMEEWWSQILNNCQQMSLDHQRVCSCKDKIVSLMDRQGRLALPRTIFNDDKNIIEAFVSNGLLVINRTSVAFTHQSFLDYFLAQKVIEKLYEGANLVDLYRPVKQQLPALRYRFLMVLQTLLDSDPDVFVEQAKNILECDDIHYYFKCAVFEIIGQWDGEIEPGIFALVRQYQNVSQWKQFIFRTVYLGHLNFIQHYFDGCEQAWLDKDGMQLLQSISDSAPDFVFACVQPYAFQSQEIDQKILSILSRDVASDTDEVFALRLEILKKYPQEFKHSTVFWRPSHLPIKRLLELMKGVLEAEELWKSENIYFGDDRDCTKIVQKSYSEIVKTLFPYICSITQKLKCPGPYHQTVWENRPWERHEYPHYTARKLVEFVKTALEEYVRQKPQEAFDTIVYPQETPSIVGHELVMHVASLLPDAFATKVLQWLLKDFRNRIFVYTFDERDYLSYTKKIISKFSKSCDEPTLKLLEETIYKWNDDPSYAIKIFERRIKFNRESQNFPVYYAYWGHLQKELLPAIDGKRLSQKARDLLLVVQRNDWIYVPFYHAGSWSEDGGRVASPIERQAEYLSDKKWLEIISTPVDKMKPFKDRRNRKGEYVETSPSMFASSLQVCVKKHPNRFATLALSFPKDCYSGYVSTVFYGLAEAENAEMTIDRTTVCQLIEKYFRNKDVNIVWGILHLIRQTAEADWPESILQIVIWLARNHPNPEGNAYVVHSKDDPKNKTVDTIKNSSFNCVRGEALFTLADLVGKHPEWLYKVRETVTDAADDVNDSVRFALPPLASMFYGKEPAFARSVLQKLLAKDIRVIASRGAWYLIRRDFLNGPAYYRNLLETGCQSEVDDLAECAAGQLCALVLLFNDIESLNWLQTHQLSHKQLENICENAIYCFREESSRKLSETILRYCVQATTEKLTALHRLFYDERIDLDRDKEFVLFLMSSDQGAELSHAFLEYLNASPLRGMEYAVYLRAIASVQQDNSDWYFLDAPKFVDSVLRLLDDNKSDDEIVKMALTIWDELYEKSFSNVQQLSEMLNNLE